MAVRKKRLADYGLQSERTLMRAKGPSVFEKELGADEIEDRLMLTTVKKAVAWAQGYSIWPDTFGLACCAIEMIVDRLLALRRRPLRRRGLPLVAAPG